MIGKGEGTLLLGNLLEGQFLTIHQDLLDLKAFAEVETEGGLAFPILVVAVVAFPLGLGDRQFIGTLDLLPFEGRLPEVAVFIGLA